MGNPRPPQSEGRPPVPTGGRLPLWVVGRNRVSCERVLACLEKEPFQAEVIPAEWVETESLSLSLKARPVLIVLDIEEDVDWGARIIDQVRRMRIDAPMVVVTEAFSRDFGAKIISRGVPYYFPHDFSASEFLEVVHNLTKQPDGAGD